MSWSEAVSNWFWNPSFWLPLDLTWEELLHSTSFQYPDWRDIWTHPILIALFILILRTYVLYPFVFSSIGKSFGIVTRKGRPPLPNKTLESIFVLNKGCVPAKAIEEAAVSLQLTQRQVERWLRSRSALTKLTKEDKFNESAFIFTYHLLASVFTAVILYPKPWAWDISQCFSRYPYYEVDNDIWWLYMVSTGFYWSQLFWQTRNSHGNDEILSYVHHVFTLFLLTFSWMCNFTRIGSLVILVHEFGGDVLLQFGKMCRYVHYEKYIDLLYVLFVISWLTSRMVVYPMFICRYTLFEAPKFMFMPAGNVFYFLLLGLLFINCGWTTFLLISIYKRITKGSIENVASSEDNRNTETESDRKTD